MAIEKQFNSRMQQKIDTAANWAKATNFVPKKGEIIVYSDGGGVGVPKIKVGDGTTVVGSLKFLVDGNITWDSNQNVIFPAGITARSFNGPASSVSHSLSINGNTYNGSSAVSLSSQQLGVPSAFIAKSVSALDCNNEKIGRVLSSSAANSLVNGPAEIGSTGAGVLWNIPLSAPTSSINEAGTQQKLYQIFVYDSGKVYLRKNSSNDIATWTYGTWEKLLTDVNITADNITTALGYAPVKDVRLNGESLVQDSAATIPMTGYNRLGVVQLDPAGFAAASVDGKLALVPPTDAQISTHTHTQRPITPSCMDYAVKAAMCDGKGAAWTSAEQKAARERMGIDKAYELIESITTDGTSIVEREVEPNGTPYNFSHVIVVVTSPKNMESKVLIYVSMSIGSEAGLSYSEFPSNIAYYRRAMYSANVANGIMLYQVTNSTDVFDDTQDKGNTDAIAIRQSPTLIFTSNNIKKIRIFGRKTSAAPAGFLIQVYGVRA